MEKTEYSKNDFVCLYKKKSIIKSNKMIVFNTVKRMFCEEYEIIPKTKDPIKEQRTRN